jgi:hypothetical protein
MRCHPHAGQHAGPYGKGVSTDSLEFNAGPPCPTLIRPAGGPPPKRPFWGWPARRVGGLRPSSSPLDTPSRTGLANTPTGKQPSAGQKLLYSTYDKGEEPPSLRLIDVWVGGAFEALQDAVPDGARVLHLLQEHDVVVIRA